MAVMTVSLFFNLFVVLTHCSKDSWSPEGEKEYTLIFSFSVPQHFKREPEIHFGIFFN